MFEGEDKMRGRLKYLDGALRVAQFGALVAPVLVFSRKILWQEVIIYQVLHFHCLVFGYLLRETKLQVPKLVGVV